MTTLAALASLVATLAVGRAAVALVWRDPSREPGAAVLAWGVAFPAGVLVVGAWLRALAAIGIAWSTLAALVPVLAAIAVLAWQWRTGLPGRCAATVRALAGSGFVGAARVAWLALLGWLALRFAFVLSEALARPPLPWEAWLDTAARGSVWHALGAPADFVASAQWTAGQFLAALPQGHSLLPLLDVHTALVVGRFDDTVIHAPWPMFWLSLVLLVYGAMRAAGSGMLAALAGATLAGTLPLASAHAALGGTAALPLAAYLLAAAIFIERAVAHRALPDGVLAVVSIAGMLWASRAGALWLPVLLPIAAAAPLRPGQAPRIVGGIVAAAAIAAIALVRQDPFARAASPGTPPGLGALVEQVLLLGNWHLLGYAAMALAVLAWRQWRAPSLIGWSGAVGVGVTVLAVFATSAAGRATIGPTGIVGHAMTAFAPLLALWVARVSWTWVRDASVPAEPQPAPGAPAIAPAAAAETMADAAAARAPVPDAVMPATAPPDAEPR